MYWGVRVFFFTQNTASLFIPFWSHPSLGLLKIEPSTTQTMIFWPPLQIMIYICPLPKVWFLSAADRRRRRRCMSGNVRPSVRLSVCLSVRPTSFATFDHFTEVLSMRNRYGWCILLQATFRHRSHGWIISRFSAAVQKLVIFSYFFTFLRTPLTFLIEGC